MTEPHGEVLSRIDSVDSRAPALTHELPANPHAPRMARKLLRDWLSQRQWPAEDVDDLVWAVSEAATNAVKHAYPAEQEDQRIVLAASALCGPNGTQRAVISITDHGCWRPASGHPRLPGPRSCHDALVGRVTRAQRQRRRHPGKDDQQTGPPETSASWVVGSSQSAAVIGPLLPECSASAKICHF